MPKKIGLRIALGVVSVLVLVLGIWAVSPGFRASAQQRSAGLRPTARGKSEPAITAPAPANMPAGLGWNGTAYTYKTDKPEPLAVVVRHYWPQTEYMTRAEFENAIRQSNNLAPKTNYLKAKQQVVVPGVLTEAIIEKPVSVPTDFEVRAVYLTGAMAGSQKGLDIVRKWRQLGGNAVVFDIKDSDGSLSVPFEHPLAPHKSPAIPNLPKYVHYLHSLGFHAIARQALFRDDNIAQHHPDLAPHSRRSGAVWVENGKQVWTDPSDKEVQDYNIALAKWVATSGVDEIQFDYVRFPAEGDQKDARFDFEAKHPQWKRADVIADFLSRAYSELHPTGVLMSLDVFGIMAWQRSVDLSHTGQDITRMARYCDVLSPMIYPSHFFGMDGYKVPGDAPEHFIGESMDRFKKITADTGVVLRPWLQAFSWRTPSYSPAYIRTQVNTSKQHGGIGFLFWNARNDYAKPYVAMPDMKTAGLLRGDEVVTAHAKFMAQPTKPVVPTRSADGQLPVAPTVPVDVEKPGKTL